MILCDQGTQTDESFHEEVVIPRSPEEEPSPKKSPKKFHHLVKIALTYHHDELSDDSNNSESEEDSKPVNPQNDVKFIVFKEQLDKLLKRCPECGTGIRKKYTSTQASVARYTEVHQWSCLHLGTASP